jgi:hypothetical protein
MFSSKASERSRSRSIKRLCRNSARMLRSMVYPAAIPTMTEDTKKKLLLTRMSVGVCFTQTATTS